MIVLTFPGQGAQAPGMGEPWLGHPSWSVVDEVATATGRDVAGLLLRTDAATLTETRNAQLATFATSLIVRDALARVGVVPTLVAGHSLGEYTALVAAGVLSTADGARLVAARGDAMQAAADERPGTMAAVLGLDAPAVAEACADAGGEVWLANDNAPGQAVIAGDPDAITAAGATARARGARRLVPLPVGGAFHTPFMAPATDRLADALGDVEWLDGRCPVVANVDAEVHGPGATWPGLLRDQLTSPVRWRESLGTIADAGGSVLVEAGPGGVLTGLAKRTVGDLARLAVSDPTNVEAAGAAVADAGRAWGR
ncbi:MAG: ACP S-malonyltransferase [Acidimicrobiales bacterium]